MGSKKILDGISKKLETIVPSKIIITKVEFEGPIVVIYTKNPEDFAKNTDLVKKIAQGIRKRVAIRPDPSLLVGVDDAQKKINEIVPPDAEITDISFEPENGEVTIEALNPGIAIGKHGTILNELKKKIGWVPRVARTPPIPSKTVREIRAYIRTIGEERQKFLTTVGRKIFQEVDNSNNWVRVTFLGGYREVGRSCTMISTRHSKVLVDCGVNVGDDNNSSPYLNAPEVLPLDSLDGVVITHAHLDHSGLVPLLFKFGYRGPVYCTPPTRDLCSLLQIDYLKVAVGEGKRPPYESSHVREAVKHTIPLRYGDTTDIAPDMRLTLQNAGHILGSSIAHFHVGDGLHNIAISGDIKYEKTWLFNPAVNKFPRMETLIMESTYGGYKDYQPSRREAAQQLKEIIARTMKRGGKILIPVFAVGRSQEVMIVLEQQMRLKQLPEVPVYMDGMIFEATAIHTAYPEYLNNQLRTQIFQRGDNPFLSHIFKHVETPDMREEICASPEQCIVIATSGMINGGPVMEYLKAWAPDKKNSLVFVGYQAEGTRGSRIQRGAKEITINEQGKPLNILVNMKIETCDGFSGHSDRKQLLNFFHNLDPKPNRVITCHGEESKCIELAHSLYKKRNIETRAPYNLETLRLH